MTHVVAVIVGTNWLEQGRENENALQCHIVTRSSAACGTAVWCRTFAFDCTVELCLGRTLLFGWGKDLVLHYHAHLVINLLFLILLH